MNIWKVAQGESMKPREKKMDFRLGGKERRETTRFGYSKFMESAQIKKNL
jgi:hypothetical protein